MLDSVRRTIGFNMARMHFRSRPEEIVSFTHSVSGARHALLILPFQRLETIPVVAVTNLLRERFQDKHVTVLTPIHSVELIRSLPQGRFVRIEETEFTPFYLPRPTVLQRMPRTEYDLAIDLNLDFVLPSGYICRESNARIRIGFAGEQSDLFYNFVIQTTPAPNRRQIYERLAACLAMF